MCIVAGFCAAVRSSGHRSKEILLTSNDTVLLISWTRIWVIWDYREGLKESWGPDVCVCVCVFLLKSVMVSSHKQLGIWAPLKYWFLTLGQHVCANALCGSVRSVNQCAAAAAAFSDGRTDIVLSSLIPFTNKFSENDFANDRMPHSHDRIDNIKKWHKKSQGCYNLLL